MIVSTATTKTHVEIIGLRQYAISFVSLCTKYIYLILFRKEYYG